MTHGFQQHAARLRRINNHYHLHYRRGTKRLSSASIMGIIRCVDFKYITQESSKKKIELITMLKC